ncbi:MAG: metal-dependent hydrolase [Candidatus Pacebacteria bacterium]|nr:metal-dependent hydrolase [Candidatus Paceibacterota bacterium]
MFLDIGVGILASLFVAHLYGLGLSLAFILGGIFFSLLMDADFVIHFAKGGTYNTGYRHRNLLHYPLLYIPIGMVVIGFFNHSWAILFAICSFFHFVHDSIGVGWDVQWLYPFDNRHFTLFYRYTSPIKEKLPRQFLYIWKHEDIDALAKRYGDEHWIRNMYFKLHPYALVEYAVFIVSLVVLYFYI